ncbi:MAG: GlmU family protein [Bacteroidales bacterium]|nr:GlmU family protein [Bacteroidales bacterium]
MNIILTDNAKRENLLPLTFTRPVGEIRVGAFTFAERWKKIFNANVSFYTLCYLSKKYPSNIKETNILIDGGIFPDHNIIQLIKKLKLNQALVYNGAIVAANVSESEVMPTDQLNISNFECFELEKLLEINYCFDIFRLNGEAIDIDYKLITKGRKSAVPSTTNTLIAAENIFIEESVQMEGVIINAKTGPVYIGENAEIMEGSVIRGPFVLCNNSTLKIGAKIYGPTTIGPHSKVGGEINNSIIFGYSNKAHDGFLGNSVIGEWCNIGADSNNSNLKNNYAEVRLWNYKSEKFDHTGLQFCGLIMGDHSKCGINTMFNTGTVVGVSANIFGPGFPRNFIPSFSWGGNHGFITYTKPKAYEVAKLVMERRGIEFNATEKEILTYIFELTAKYRNF